MKWLLAGMFMALMVTGQALRAGHAWVETTAGRQRASWETEAVPVTPDTLYSGTVTVNVRSRVPGAAMSVRLLLLDEKKAAIKVIAEDSSSHQALFSCGSTEFVRYSPSRHQARFMKLQIILAGNPARVEIQEARIAPDQLKPKFAGVYTPKTPYPDRVSTLADMARIKPGTARLVRKGGGRMGIEIDGRECWLKSYKGSIDYGPMAKAGCNVVLTFAAGVNLYWDKMSWDLSPYKGHGVFDFTHLENELMLIHQTAPEARVLLNIDLDPGPEFFESHPDSIFRNEAGQLAVRQFYGFAGFGVPGPNPKKHRHWIVSYASEDYLNYACDGLRKVAEFLKSSPAGNIVVGFGLQGGHDAQYLQWEYSSSRGQADYSPDNIKAFRLWLTQKYGTDARLQHAWNTPDVTLRTASLFTEKEWASRPAWTDAKTGLDRKVIDGREFMTHAIAELNRRFALTLKQAMKRPVVVGTYYSTPVWGQAGRSSLNDLSRGQAIDMVFQVSGYSTLRKLGAIGATANFAIAAAHQANMVFLQEMDHRTTRSEMTAPEHYSRIGLCYPRTVEEFQNQMFRDAGAVIAYGGDGYYYFDMFDSWFNDPEILKVIEVTNKAADWAKNYGETLPRTEAAIFLDERQRLLSREVSSAPGTIALNCRLSGMTPDLCLLQDLTKDSLPDYKLWILPDPKTLSTEQLEALQRKAQRAGKVLMITGSPGALQGTVPGQTAPTMARLGMTVQDHLEKLTDSVTFKEGVPDGLARNCRHRIGLQDVFINRHGTIQQDSVPFFATVDDAQATVLGEWSSSDRAALAVKRLPGKGTLVYSAHPCGLSPQLIHNAAREAGILPFAEPGNSIAVGHGVIAIHRLDGPVVLTFEQEMSFVDPATGKELGQGRTLTVDCGHKESRLICYRRR